MKCERCGSEVHGGGRFCGTCGAPVKDREEPDDSVFQSEGEYDFGPEYSGEPENFEEPEPGMENADADGGSGYFAAPDREKGTELPDRSARRTERRGPLLISGIVTIVLAVILALQNFAGLPLVRELAGGGTPADQGYSSPEKLMEEFGKAIAANDVDRAVSMFAVSHMTEGYDSAKMLETLQTWYMSLPYPQDEPVFENANRKELESGAARQIANLCFSLEAKEEYLQMYPSFHEGEELRTLITDVEDAAHPDALHTFRVLRVDHAGPDDPESEEAVEIDNQLAEIYGADELQQYSILYEYNGDTYIGAATVLRYDELYYINSLFSGYISNNTVGYLTPVSESAYLEQAGITG